jgi:single-strand DNA-binding protein
MSRDLFHVIIEGNLGRTPELRHTHTNSTPVCDLNVAVDRAYTNKEGERVANTQWYKVVAWGKQAENCAKYLIKGRRVRVNVARIESEVWVDRQTDEINHRPVLHASSVDFLPGGTRNDVVYEEGMDVAYADMGYAEAEAVPHPVPTPAPAPAKAKRTRTAKASVSAPVPAGFDDFADFGPEDNPF